MPFVPRIADRIVVVSGDGPRCVEEIFWSDADGFEVFLEFDDRAKYKALMKLGWRDEDKDRPAEKPLGEQTQYPPHKPDHDILEDRK